MCMPYVFFLYEIILLGITSYIQFDETCDDFRLLIIAANEKKPICDDNKQNMNRMEQTNILLVR